MLERQRLECGHEFSIRLHPVSPAALCASTACTHCVVCSQTVLYNKSIVSTTADTMKYKPNIDSAGLPFRGKFIKIFKTRPSSQRLITWYLWYREDT